MERRLPTAVVVDVRWVNGLAAIRSLGRLGVPVVALAHRAGALGFRSRYARGLVCPDPFADEAGYVAFLAELGESFEAPAPVFPTHDEFLNAIARNADALGGRYLHPFPDWELLEKIQDKAWQLEQAERLGIPAPRTAEEPADDLTFPVLVKPRDPVGFRREFRRQAFRCEDPETLAADFERARPYRPLVQEFVPGGDEELYTLGSYLDATGEALGLFSGRKLLQTPPGVGSCRIGESVWVDQVVEQGLTLLRGIGFRGLSQVEFKRDARDGRYKLMEINPRLWQWHGLAAATGVDLTRIAYLDLIGEPPPPARMNGDGRRWAITLAPGERPAFPRPPYVDGVFARDDPRPALANLARVVRRAVR
jgi:predicted ATP-grasp superfamily ATP-dependent carboligase